MADLPPSDELAVIINVNTKVVATLALAATIRHAKMPVLMVDCESTDGSLEHFTELMGSVPFHLVSAPLRSHGRTLDALFADLPAPKVLLVDSDLEILDDRIVAFFRDFIDDEQTFGAGFVNGPGWIGDHAGTSYEAAYYQERIWMPITLLKTDHVRVALAAGQSFDAHTVYNGPPRFSRLAARVHEGRHGELIARTLNRAVPRPLRRSYYGHRPAVVMCDTGADIFQYLRYQRELVFAGLPEAYHPRYVTHLFGTTRNALGVASVHGGDRHHANMETARTRLKDLYQLEVD